MEDWEYEFINKNLGDLVASTTCSDDLLQLLHFYQILDTTDIQVLKREEVENGEMAQTIKLYAMLQVRSGSFEGLISALKKTNQKAALKILEGGFQNSDNKLKRDSTDSIRKNAAALILGQVATVCFTALFVTIYMWYSLNIAIYISILAAIVIGVGVFALSVKISFMRAVILLVTPELTARTVRIGFVHILMVLAPLQLLQDNSEIFFNSIVCTFEKALEVARNTSGEVVGNAFGGVQESIDGINRISDELERVISEPIDKLFEEPIHGVEIILDEIANLQGYCETGMSEISTACQSVFGLATEICSAMPGQRRKKRGIADVFDKLKDAADKIKDGIKSGAENVEDEAGSLRGDLLEEFNHICDTINGVSDACNKIEDVPLCDAFSKIDDVREKVKKFKETVINMTTEEFRFRVVISHETNTTGGNKTLENVKKSLKDQVQQKIDIFLAFKRIWTAILSLSVLHIFVAKALLVRKYNKREPIECKLISIFFLLTNPFTLQLVFLFLTGSLHFLFYFIHEIFRDSILQENIKLEVDFNASLITEGGDTGKKIAGVLINAFQLHKQINSTVNLEECFVESVKPPNLIEYLIVVSISAVGILTYAVDMFSRKRQRQLIEYAYSSK